MLPLVCAQRLAVRPYSDYLFNMDGSGQDAGARTVKLRFDVFERGRFSAVRETVEFTAGPDGSAQGSRTGQGTFEASDLVSAFVDHLPRSTGCIRVDRGGVDVADLLTEWGERVELAEAIVFDFDDGDPEALVVIDGSARFVPAALEAPELAEQRPEDCLRVIWEFHADAETGGPMTSEYHDYLGSSGGLYYFVKNSDGDRDCLRLGTFSSEADAVAAALEHSEQRYFE